MKPRVLLGDSQPLVAEAFARLLEPGFEVVGHVTGGAELVEQARRLRPDVVLTDVALRQTSGLAAARRLRRELPGARVVFLAAATDARVAAEAFRDGAMAYVARSASASDLHQALHAVLRGELWLSPRIAGGNPFALPSVADPSGPLRRLSPRRREVVKLLAEGHSMKQAAAVLGLSTRTIAFHKYEAMKALDVTTSAGLVRFAVESRLLSARAS